MQLLLAFQRMPPLPGGCLQALLDDPGERELSLGFLQEQRAPSWAHLRQWGDRRVLAATPIGLMCCSALQWQWHSLHEPCPALGP